MPLPKRRHSRRRRDTRRAHDALKPVSITTCLECGEPVRSHCACSSCGFYNGRQVIQVEEE